MKTTVFLSFFFVSCGLGYGRIDTHHKVGGTAKVEADFKAEVAIDEASRKLCESFENEKRRLECVRLMTESLKSVASAVHGNVEQTIND